MTSLLAVTTDDCPSFADWQTRIHAFLDDHAIHDRVITVYYQSALRTDFLSPPIRWLMPGEAPPLAKMGATSLLIEQCGEGLTMVYINRMTANCIEPTLIKEETLSLRAH